MMTRLFRKTFRDERGSFSVEAILMFPMLVWAFMAMYVFFEGLRESNINLKATYTVADVLSRETEEIDMRYLNNMNTIYEWLARTDQDTEMRVSVVIWDDVGKKHDLYWSEGVNGREDLTQEMVRTNITPHVPILAHQATAIVVETWVDYTPIMDIPIMPIGLRETEIYNIVVTAPRFTDQLKFEGMGDGTGSAHDDDVDVESGEI
ncbi:MAG: TadE/TadG family type IV pilus assembly protein [Paracoccaceae bacterium]